MDYGKSKTNASHLIKEMRLFLSANLCFQIRLTVSLLVVHPKTDAEFNPNLVLLEPHQQKKGEKKHSVSVQAALN